MLNNSTQVSLDTIAAASPLLGHELEDRSVIREAQQTDLVERLSRQSRRLLPRASELGTGFIVAPLDILVSESAGRKQFHLLEMNGTGIGGLTNLPETAVVPILRSLEENAQRLTEANGVVLVAVSGKESDASPRRNRLLHEKLLFVEALRAGLTQRFGSSEARNLDQMAAEANTARPLRPTVVLGYIKDLMNALALGDDGSLRLHGRPVMAAVNDRFCSNLVRHFNGMIDMRSFRPLNHCYTVGSDKGVAYQMTNEYVHRHPHASLPSEVRYAHAHCRSSLLRTVLRWVNAGRQVVIKPQGTGLGHGIEFFLSPDESREVMTRRIDRSLRQTEEYYGIAGGALPYTVCEYVDACKIDREAHPQQGHKFELRVVVYRDGNSLRALPSIAKVAREKEAGGTPLERRALINNITASGDTVKVCGTDYVLPLCNRETMATLGLSLEDMEDVCRFAVGVVGHTIDAVDEAPEEFGLPPHPPEEIVGRISSPTPPFYRATG